VITLEILLISGLPCADCLDASGNDLTLTPDTDPLWIPNPDFKVPSPSDRFSPMCRWAIRFYLYAVNPNRSDNTMHRMCSSITEFGSTAIVCLAKDFPEVALTAMGQYVRCCYAKKALGKEWGTEKGEETVFMNAPTDASMSAVDFIRDGFQQLKMKRKSGRQEGWTYTVANK
jgi:hypothetical protein